MIIRIIFWILVAIIVYAYIGYAIFLFFISLFYRERKGTHPNSDPDTLPEITLLIAAYNEKEIIPSKMVNTNSLEYPRSKLKIVWVTDGSDDGSDVLLKNYPEVRVLHQAKREGKSQAINRAMNYIKTPIVVMSDANAMLNSSALLNIACGFQDHKTGCIAGEKRINRTNTGGAASAGEGAYWRYESFLKRMESKIGSAIGGAGELIAFRRELFTEIDREVINDDLDISLKVIIRGFKVKYCPDSHASENASLNMAEEIKRKIRITAGGMQCLVSNFKILNPLKYGFYSFQFFSHKVLRWTLVPFSFLPLLFINALIAICLQSIPAIYLYLLILQVLLYFMALAGALLNRSKLRIRLFYIPYYLFSINYAAILGVIRFARDGTSPVWEKARRMT